MAFSPGDLGNSPLCILQEVAFIVVGSSDQQHVWEVLPSKGRLPGKHDCQVQSWGQFLAEQISSSGLGRWWVEVVQGGTRRGVGHSQSSFLMRDIITEGYLTCASAHTHFHSSSSSSSQTQSHPHTKLTHNIMSSIQILGKRAWFERRRTYLFSEMVQRWWWQGWAINRNHQRFGRLSSQL